MSIRLMTLVWDMEQLNPTDTLVLLALADNASDEGNCFPSIGTIAKKNPAARTNSATCLSGVD